MGKVFCLPVFSRKANKIKLELPEGDESFTVSTTPASQAAPAITSPDVELQAIQGDTQSCFEHAAHEEQVALEVGDVFSDPGLYGRDFTESSATSEEAVDATNTNAIAININDATDDARANLALALPEERKQPGDDDHNEDDQFGDEEDDQQRTRVVLQSSDFHSNTTTKFTTQDRVEEWVKSIDASSTEPLIELPVGETPTTSHAARSSNHSSRDVELANSVARSLDFHSTTVAHFSGIGLTLIPCLSTFSHLKTLKLSGNAIVRITPGVLPKGLHSLDLSRNKISVIEGLRELTKLRSLNLSYNRILRIGQGLANCTSIRELYLACNKINEVEGLHRLTKLSCLDLSFNRLASTKSLGQIAAAYTSLVAINLVGNPVVVNVGEEQLKRFVTGLAPNLIFLNKQPIKGGISNRDAVARSFAAGSSRHSPHHNASSSKRSSSASTSSTALRVGNRGGQHQHHHHHHHEQQPLRDSKMAQLKSIHRVQSDGALQNSAD
ncbi:hypothetical protein SELMODRAFT_447926 [Selaginella moellendorffii]|uniref:U2A'/phosphoprotein 32 family A C-terminal domain-containing protein n=1 Tax=Selaginella moellendorffii TaxID=88036 RepID=D8T3K3_SELML|nr:uncharacterized protein LOC9647625 [Selaginella moellendorffii]EFJ08712.1 hypothetical protein SELMODRAFT_447926 [Selaginella moellendorffii]|eukprot:XP_002990152.1 uncharacterized protein LOC9647625 [Selaginella moellendorffii]